MHVDHKDHLGDLQRAAIECPRLQVSVRDRLLLHIVAGCAVLVVGCNVFWCSH